MVRLPRIVIAAPGSGHGKTMVATGLMAALRAEGYAVSPHKVGPDYIDPSYHSLASGRPGRNLDPHLVGEDLIAPLLAHGAATPAPADIAVIEGVMGLFDGALGRGGFSSTAHVARLVHAPVVLVVDCAATARSVGAIVHGFTTYDPQVRVAGVILNNVGSERHEAEARGGIAETGVPVLGCVPRLPDIVVPSRHLGLVPVAERRPEAAQAVNDLGDLIAARVDLAAILELARSAPDLAADPWDPASALGTPPVEGRPRVAVAGGEAFSFAYAETAELLSAAGAEVVAIDPLRDDRLPDDVRGLVLGGGFPEVHAGALSANSSLREDVRRFAEVGGVVVAECAGLLYLGRALEGAPMCGVLQLEAAMGERLILGYRSAVALADSPICREGERVTGHEFHRTQISATAVDVQRHEGPDAPRTAWGWQTGAGPATDGYASATLHASYLHVHWAGHPQLAHRFVAAAAGAPTEVIA